MFNQLDVQGLKCKECKFRCHTQCEAQVIPIAIANIVVIANPLAIENLFAIVNIVAILNIIIANIIIIKHS